MATLISKTARYRDSKNRALPILHFESHTSDTYNGLVTFFFLLIVLEGSPDLIR